MTVPAVAPTRRRHVHEADVVRVLTFACVIAVHTIHYTNPAQSVGANGVEMLLHFTREAFFCLTGFVLVHQSLGRPLAVKPFWRKRFLAIGIPYVVWTVIYEVIKVHESGLALVRHLPQDLVLGTAWYHLYFLLVSMQIYLVFPVILWLVRRTAGHHAALLTLSAVIQLAWTGWLMYGAPSSGWLEHLAVNADALLPSYQFYVLVGAVAAFHFERTIEAVRTYRAAILALAVIVAFATEVFYLVAVQRGTSPSQAASVLQPAMLPWALASIALLFALGSLWDERRVPGSRLDRGLDRASDRSFAVFLVHPLMLWLLLEGLARWWHVTLGPALSIGAYVFVLATSLAAAELIRHSYLSLPLSGRPRLKLPNPPSPQRGEDHESHHPAAAGAPVQAPHQGDHDGDRRRPADALLR